MALQSDAQGGTVSNLMMVRVTEALRNQWRIQRDQAIEERTHDQSGRRRSPAGVADQDFEVELMDYLLSLPIGTKFNGQQVQAELLEKKQAKLPRTQEAP